MTEAVRLEVYRTLARTVGSDFCVAVDTNRYSVSPRFAGCAATVRLYATRLEIRVEETVVVGHTLYTGRYQRILLPEHEEEFRRHGLDRGGAAPERAVGLLRGSASPPSGGPRRAGPPR